jgi:hypothetical protein
MGVQCKGDGRDGITHEHSHCCALGGLAGTIWPIRWRKARTLERVIFVAWMNGLAGPRPADTQVTSIELRFGQPVGEA